MILVCSSQRIEERPLSSPSQAVVGAHIPPAIGGTRLFEGYDPGSFYDELVAPDGTPRPAAAAMHEILAGMPLDVFEERRQLADLSYLV